MTGILKNNKFFLILIILFVADFFYCFNLSNTYWFAGDMARDTLKALRILNTHDITLIGPPLSFGQYGFREIYFGSLSYYFGVLGLLLTNKNLLGPIFVNVVFMDIGLICFYLFVKEITGNIYKALFVTFLYALSPLIVVHMRFFWNPNFILSISPIFWYFYYLSTKKDAKFLYAVICGLLGGVLINLHYFVLPVVVLAVPSLFIIPKNKRIWIAYIFGLLIGILPMILFEVKHNFYLTQAVIFNISHPGSFYAVSKLPWIIKIMNSLRIIPILLGLDHDVTYIPIIFSLSYFVKIVLGFFLLTYVLFVSLKEKIFLRLDFIFFILLSVAITILFSQEDLYIRYFFVSLPLLVLIVGLVIQRNKFFMALVGVTILIVSFRILTFQIYNNNRHGFFPTTKQMQYVEEIIKNDKPSSPYNITESFIGDAQALYLRYFLEKDQNILQPNNEKEYTDLKMLYVFSPNLDIVLKENRWEFHATKNLKLKKTFKIDTNMYLYRFDAV